MSTTATEPEINHLLSFWFAGGSQAYKRWFQGGPSFDEELRTKFEPLVKRARASELATWTETPKGNLGLLILLDQIPRNIYRGSGESYASDLQARDVAVTAIAAGVDRQLSTIERSFFYLPLMHDENMISQIACLAFYEQLLVRCESEGDEELTKFIVDGIEMAKRHIVTISKFGRFPGRNIPMGRESSEEEKKYLEDNPAGF